MNRFSEVMIHTTDGALVGYAIVRGNQMASLLIYKYGEEEKLIQRLKELNEQATLKEHWPKGNDPEVQALLDDEKFMPVATYGQLRIKQAMETVARQRAGLAICNGHDLESVL
jgi:hypothetical protein